MHYMYLVKEYNSLYSFIFQIIYGQHVTPIISSMQRLDIDYFLTFEIDEIFWLNYQIYLPYGKSFLTLILFLCTKHTVLKRG